MRIAFIGGFAFSPKGTMRARALPLGAQLVRQGHEVTIFLTPYDNLHDSGRQWEQDGVRIRNLRVGNGTLSYFRLLTALIREVNHYRPDLIHIFKPKGFAGAAGSYLLLKGTRSIALDCDDWEGWGGWNDVKPYPWILKEYIDRQERWMMRSAPVVTVASHTLQDRATKIRGTRDGIYYVPNCGAANGNLSAQARVRCMLPSEIRGRLGLPEGLIILYSGHFAPGEDVIFLCRAARKVAAQQQASFVFVGDGPDLQQVRDFCKYSNVIAFFFPHLPYEQFLQVIWASDVAAFPYPDDSVHRAKCSARMVDYMAMGKAVLTSAVGQNCEYIVNGESGLLARPNDEPDFAAKLDWLARDPDLRQRLGRNAEQRIREKFSWSGEPLQQCLTAYERIVHPR